MSLSPLPKHPDLIEGCGFAQAPRQETILIRAFVPADQDAARTLILAGLGEYFGVIDPALNPDLDDIAAAYLACGHAFRVAEIADNLVGTGGLRVTGQEGQIVRVSVAPAARRRGLGRRLVISLLALARQRGLRRVWMETNDDWHAAIALYADCSFQPFDQRDGCIFMELKLTPNDNSSCNQNTAIA